MGTDIVDRLINGRIDLRIISKVSTNEWKIHKHSWEDCTKCGLAGRRERVVFYRGVIPCDVLFIGEAPGRAEDLCGKPFVGDAGHILQDTLKQVSKDVRFTFAITNLVSCVPLQWSAEKEGYEIRNPGEDEIKTCANKLAEFIYISDPKLIVFLGNYARDWYPLGTGRLFPSIPTTDIVHPAYLLRQPEPVKGVLIARMILRLVKEIRNTCKGGCEII